MTRSFNSQRLDVRKPTGHSSDRRSFLKLGAVAGLGLILEVRAGGISKALAGTNRITESEPLFPSARIRIGSDNRIQLVSHKFDSGTGMRNALGLILAEELDVDWNKVEVVSPDDPLAKEYIHPLWGCTQLVAVRRLLWNGPICGELARQHVRCLSRKPLNAGQSTSMP